MELLAVGSMKRAQLEQYLDHPNVRRFLDYIAQSEGTSKNGYQTAFGGGVIGDLSRHPNKRHTFRQTDGKTNVTTAAGRYQFLSSTWNNLANRYGFEDFGGRNQDLGAIALLADAGALNAVVNGDWSTAIKRSGKTWASLPSSTYAQPKRSMAEAERFFGSKIQPSSVPRDVINQYQNQTVDDVSSLSEVKPFVFDNPLNDSVENFNNISNFYGFNEKENPDSSDDLGGIESIYGINTEMGQYFQNALNGDETFNTLGSSGWLDKYISGLIENV